MKTIADSFAWLLQQKGRFERGEFKKADLTNVINHFDRQTRDLLRAWRCQCRATLKMLLLLWIAPAADAA